MGKPSVVGQLTRPTQPFILLDKWVVSCNPMAAITTHSSSAIWWVGYEANGRWCGETCGLPPMSLSAPSCKAGVYARCWLKTIEMGDERPLLVLWVVRGLLPLRLLCVSLRQWEREIQTESVDHIEASSTRHWCKWQRTQWLINETHTWCRNAQLLVNRLRPAIACIFNLTHTRLYVCSCQPVTSLVGNVAGWYQNSVAST